ncbi:stalk domain-containing protein [Saccharibacillus sp. CPCC 101409]|uniref:stalk domain-containing protein n=1 Tax=Saccharibacillus sp. CPCC 101409 TaxID=3058041 RepID=UPI0026736035|nr:stalk domain-containing protein [Saccharibacillus sp. CPCC 101409]MDO3413304.1 stalk domain-containing protein [Saccharibacillus sp. CPCC 101409]
MKKLIVTLVLMVGIATVVPNAYAAESLRTRANNLVEASYYTNVNLNVIGEDSSSGNTNNVQKFKSKFVPLRSVFGKTGDSVKWNNKTKVASIENSGKKFILNFSNIQLTAKEGEVVAPRTWVQMKDGQALIDIYVLTYILDRYGDSYKDSERDQWQESLNFLNIKYMEYIPGVRSHDMNIFITLK